MKSLLTKMLSAAALAALLLSPAARSARAAEVPQPAPPLAQNMDLTRFLPNDGNNVYNATGLLRAWPAAGPKELWRATIGVGKSAVLESNGRLFTAAQFEGKQWALCLDPKTGKTLWKHELLNKENTHQVRGPVTSPIIDGDRVYYIPYLNNKGDFYDILCPVFCLRVADGSEVWHEDKLYTATEASVPLILGDTLYIAANRRESVLVAVDKMTGKLRWKVNDPVDTQFNQNNKIFGSSSSLTVQMLDGIPTIITGVYKNDHIGVDTRTGKILWHYALPVGPSSGIVSTPVAVGNRLFISAFQAQSSWGVCLEMVKKGDLYEPKVVYSDQKLQCNAIHTISILDGAVYGFGRGASSDALQCTNFADGKLLWQQEGPDWTRNSQLTIADGLIFALTRNDELVLAEASKTGYKELGRVKPGIKLCALKGTQQQPTIANGKLYLRGEDTVICYQITPDAK